MLHTIARRIRSAYPAVVFGGYLVAFFLAFVMVFMLPIGALALVFVGLLALVPLVVVWGIVRMVEKPLALGKIRQGICPACASHAIHWVESDGGFRCSNCSMRFGPRGDDLAQLDPESDEEPTTETDPPTDPTTSSAPE
ncbi:MAG: hypothetical protein EXS15_01295 [Phycisphaerales bacterium]|nr:hypothetical protein [Phycisphaerales bacterium]